MKSIPVTPGNKYTILTISAPATLRRKQVVIVSALEAPEFRPSPNGLLYCIGTCTMPHDRACRNLDIDILGALVIAGWDQFKNSSARPKTLAPETIHAMLDANLNPHFERYELLAYSLDLPDPEVPSELLDKTAKIGGAPAIQKQPLAKSRRIRTQRRQSASLILACDPSSPSSNASPDPSVRGRNAIG